MRFSLKPGFNEDMSDLVEQFFEDEMCGSITAARLLGKAVWGATTVHCKCGRDVRAALVKRQHFETQDDLTEDLDGELAFSQFLHQFVGPRKIQISLTHQPSARLYLGASCEPAAGQPAGAGFVLFSPLLPLPLGGLAVLLWRCDLPRARDTSKLLLVELCWESSLR